MIGLSPLVRGVVVPALRAYKNVPIRDLAPILRRNLVSFSSYDRPPKDRKWVYFSWGLLTGVSVYNALESYKQRTITAEYETLIELSKSTHSLSSGRYTASSYNPIPSHILDRMQGFDNPITGLAYVRVTHYNHKGEICLGELLVHKELAVRVMQVFQDMFMEKLPIKGIHLNDCYDAEDAVINAFNRRGFAWGGDWRSLRDEPKFAIDGAKVGVAVP